MARMQSPTDRNATVTFTCDEETADALSELADSQDMSRAALLRELSQDAIGSDTGSRSDTHEPADGTLQKVYDAALEASNERLVLNMRKHGSLLAQKSQQSQDILYSYLKELERKGYAREQGGEPGGKQTQTAWRIKPKCATVQHWKYRKQVNQ